MSSGNPGGAQGTPPGPPAAGTPSGCPDGNGETPGPATGIAPVSGLGAAAASGANRRGIMAEPPAKSKKNGAGASGLFGTISGIKKAYKQRKEAPCTGNVF